MPSLQEIEQFKSILNALGDEPEILAERGEEIEDIPPPDQGLPEDLSDLLETAEAGTDVRPEDLAAEQVAQAPPVEPEGGPAAPEPAAPGQAAPEPPAPGPAAPEPAAPEEQEVDLSDLFGEGELSDILEGLDLPGDEETEAPPEQAAPATEEAPPAEGATLPAEEAAQAAEEAAPPLPEETAPAAEQTAPPAGDEEEFSLEDLGFDLPESGEEETMAEETAPAAEEGAPPEQAAPAAEEAPPAEEATLPAEEAAQAAEGVAPPPLEETAPAAEQTTPPAGDEEEFSLEDLGFDLPESGEEAPAPAEGEEEFSIPSGLLEPEAAEAQEEPPESSEAEGEFELPEEFAFPPEEEAGAEAGGVPAGEEPPPAEEPAGSEDLPEMPGFDLEGFDTEALAGLQAGEEGESPGPEMPALEEPFEGMEEGQQAGEAGGPAGEEAFGEAEFGLPEDFQLPEEDLGAEGAPAQAAEPAGEQPAEPGGASSEEEAEFLQFLQDQILPEGQAGSEQPPEAPGAEDAFDAFAEAPPETGEEAQAPPEQPFEMPGQEEIPEGFPPEEGGGLPEGEQIDLEAPAAGEESPEEFVLDEFSLEGLGEAFEMEEAAAPPAGEEIPAGVEEAPEQFPEEVAVPGAEELTFTDKQFSAIKRSLSRLPRNLKIAIEELIAEKGLSGADLRSLLALLIEGAAPKAIAEQVSRLTGRRIVLPKVFERLSGVAFEERRRTFAYAFRQNILPIVRVMVLSLGFLGLLAFLGYRYVYRPVYADHLYRQGYEQIGKERYRLANDTFDRAVSTWVFKNWYYRYARGFTIQKQFQLAAEKYEQLLRRFPRDRRGKLNYASLLTYHMAAYERADQLLDQVLDENIKDYNALLAKGDNYLEWAQEDQSRYADARFAYASIIDYYGERPEVLLRMMRYFIRTDRFDETVNLKAYLDSLRRLRVDPTLFASTYSELAGYWMDKGYYESISDMLFSAMDRDMNEAGIHYQLARYFRHVQDPREEETALRTAIELLERMQPLDKKHLFMLIDAYNRRGETFWRREEYLEAEGFFQKAIARIEDAQARRIFGQREEFGLAYKNYGDIYYYISHELEPALDLYLKAINNRYETPELDYKIGYIHYSADRYEDALLDFSKVVDQRPSDENALYALANSLYERGYYSSAQGYYLRLLNLLEGREDKIAFLQIYDNPEHNALEQYIMKVYNNLGVTLKQLADRNGDPEKESKALVDLTFSSERFDMLSRDPATMERGLTKNLAYLNQGGILYPGSNFSLQIYARLPIDLQANRF